jgi:hypothetical protein
LYKRAPRIGTQLCSASRAKAADPFSSTQQALMKAAKVRRFGLSIVFVGR